MKFQIATEVFSEGIQQVQSVVSSKATLPILSNVLIKAHSKGLSLRTTDLDVSISVEIPAEVEVQGSTTLPARKLATIIRELPGADVLVEVSEKNEATIKSGPSNFVILGLTEAEFPPIGEKLDGKQFKISQAVLKDALKKTSYAISTDETRYVLNGIFASFKDSKVTLVATDGRRLAMIENEIDFEDGAEVDVIIPAKAVSELSRLLGTNGEIKLTISEGNISFELQDCVLTSKLIDGNYPNYRQVIPQDKSERISLSRDALLETVRRVSILSSDKSNSIKLLFSDNKIEVSSNSPDVGSAKETIDVVYSGKEFAIAFNPDYMMSPLKNLDVDTVYLDLIDEMSPGVIRIDGAFLYVLMPMRVTQK